MSTFHNLHFVQGNNEYDYYPQVDDTLSVEGRAADAKAVGDEISDLKSDLNNVNETLFLRYGNRISEESGDVANSWKLDGNGICVSNNSYKIYKYAVTAGDVIWVRCDDVFQFQSAKSIPSYQPNTGLVGVPITVSTDGVVVVPSGATWLMVSTSTANSADRGLYNFTSVVDVLNGKVSTLYTPLGEKRKSPDASSDNYGIKTNGLAVYDATYRLLKYKVVEGEYVWIKCGEAVNGRAVYQFQSSTSVSQSSNPYLIGTPVSVETDTYVEVPTGATYLIFGVLKTDSTSGVYELDRIVQIENSVNEIEKIFDGIDESLDLSAADNGQSYGSHYVVGKFYKGTTLTVMNNNTGNYNLSVYVKNNNEIIQQIAVTQNTTVSVALVGNADTIQVYCNAYPTKGKLTLEAVDYYQNKEIEKLNGYHGIGNDIVLMNAAVPTKLQNAQKLNWSDTIVPFSILHFSDPHGSTTTVERIIQYSDYISSYIDDIICTGDMVNNKYSDGYSWWDDIDGSENILTCIGNHDVSDGVVYNSYGVSPSDAYDAYFAPYISNWDVEHTGSLTYYYKDYAAKKIRLIVLDYLLTGSDATAQNTWLQSVLAGAKTNGYTVIIAEHIPVCNTVYFPCNFTMIDKSTVYTQFSETYQASVQDFVNGGGKFACYLVGHTHCDMICYNSNYPNQLCIAVTIAAQTGRDNDQVRSGKARDAFNIVTVDTNSETIKLTRVGADIDNYLRGRNVLTLSYANKSIIAEY